jgi:hypothetical protein
LGNRRLITLIIEDQSLPGIEIPNNNTVDGAKRTQETIGFNVKEKAEHQGSSNSK